MVIFFFSLGNHGLERREYFSNGRNLRRSAQNTEKQKYAAMRIGSGWSSLTLGSVTEFLVKIIFIKFYIILSLCLSNTHLCTGDQPSPVKSSNALWIMIDMAIMECAFPYPHLTQVDLCAAMMMKWWCPSPFHAPPQRQHCWHNTRLVTAAIKLTFRIHQTLSLGFRGATVQTSETGRRAPIAETGAIFLLLQEPVHVVRQPWMEVVLLLLESCFVGE